MKKFLPLIAVMFFAAGAWAQQSLGEIARINRAKKKPASTIRLNDDNMPRTLTSNADDSTKEAAPAAGQNSARSDSNKDKKEASSEKPNEKMTGEINKQKEEVARLQHELDIAQREQRLNAAAYYGDAGVRLRDQAKFAEDSRKKQEEIDGKKKAIEAAQQKLTDLQEQARKAGLHSTD